MIERIFGRAVTTIRIPLSGSIPIPYIVKRLIETPEWQRLLGIKQLGPAYNVYPGATHTRAEHSLGVFALLDRYIEKLLTQEEFQKNVSQTKLSALLLAGLLHDVGQPPLSHWTDKLVLPDGERLPSHEERAKEVILNGKSGKYIEKELGMSSQVVVSMIEGKDPIAQLLCGEFDADRVDFLQRDALHTGVPYGTGFDIERLVSSLWWDAASGRLMLTRKGIHPLLSFLSAYDIMYEAVYFHKTVHATFAMVRKAVRELYKRSLISAAELKKIMNMTDWEFLSWAEKTAESADRKMYQLFLPLFRRERKLFKLVFEHTLGQNTISAEKAREIEVLLEKETGELLIVETVKKPLPSLDNIFVVAPKKDTTPKKASLFVRFKPYAPISLLRVYAPEEARDRILSEVTELVLHNVNASMGSVKEKR